MTRRRTNAEGLIRTVAIAQLVVMHLVGWFLIGGVRGASIGLASTSVYALVRLTLYAAQRACERR